MAKSALHSEAPPEYKVVRSPRARAQTLTEDEVVAAALDIVRSRLRKPGDKIESPQSAKDYFTLLLANLQHEEFHVMFLDGQHCVIECEGMFRGTISQTSVYPREVVKRALALNAAAVVFAHNHPSTSPVPSRADEHLTQTIKQALQLVDVRVLDHLVIGGMKVVSFAELGML